MNKIPRIVTISGGTGSFVTLSGLKKYPVKLAAIVSMMDSGGSSGKLRDELGVLPPGDVRQCIVALSESPKILRDLFNYRFQEGGLKGHTFGNIFLSAMEKSTGNIKTAISEVGKILRINGQVVPVTFDRSDLCVELENGEKIIGETHIDESEIEENRGKIKKAYLSKEALISEDARKAILEADCIVIGPGDLYTSVIPILLVDGVTEAIKASKGKKVLVMNLMTKLGQTKGYTAENHIEDLENYLGKRVIDYVLLNSKKPKRETLEKYEKYGENPVTDDLNDTFKIIRKNLIKNSLVESNQSDILRRSFVRHDSSKLAAEIMAIIG